MGKLARAFQPLARPAARKLILGSMPGEASLQASQYYAHPRNLFWPFMGELLGFDSKTDYTERTARLLAADIALWDVLMACERQGSLDSAIVQESIVINDFAAFLSDHRHIHSIYFNGKKAESLFRRQVLPTIAGLRPDLHTSLRTSLRLVSLPSTSPANAAISYADKLSAWHSIID